MKDFRVCFQDMWEEQESGMPADGKKIKDTEKHAVLAWLASRTGFTQEEISLRLGEALEGLFADIEKEYGTVSEKDLDPRFMPHFCIAT
jgi:hypothetical protein